MRVNANAVLRSWTLLAAFGGSYAPGTAHTYLLLSSFQQISCSAQRGQHSHMQASCLSSLCTATTMYIVCMYIHVHTCIYTPPPLSLPPWHPSYIHIMIITCTCTCIPPPPSLPPFQGPRDHFDPANSLESCMLSSHTKRYTSSTATCKLLTL